MSGLLPKPGATSIPASGVGAGAAFKVDSKQLGKKLGKHVEDFGGNAASPADRKMVLDKIHDVGSNPEPSLLQPVPRSRSQGTRRCCGLSTSPNSGYEKIRLLIARL